MPDRKAALAGWAETLYEAAREAREIDPEILVKTPIAVLRVVNHLRHIARMIEIEEAADEEAADADTNVG